MAEAETIHATCVAIDGRGVLLLGPPGSGKSSLALQLIDQPGFGISETLRQTRLVADDQVVLRRSGGQITATAPPALAGLLEIRGIGIVRVPVLAETQVVLAVRLARATEIARLPEPSDSAHDLLGVSVPSFRIDASLAGSPARLRAALDLL